MLARLRVLVGCKFSSPHGVRGLICEHGLLCLSKPGFVLFRGSEKQPPMRDDQLYEVLRLNEQFIEHPSQDFIRKAGNDPVADFMDGLDPNAYQPPSKPRTAYQEPKIEYLK